MPATDVSGLVKLQSQHPVSTTIDRLEALLKERAILVFARIDFSGDAERAGLKMPAEQMLIFGNPKAGTPLMVAAPAAGIDLPLKMLAWETPDGKSGLPTTTHNTLCSVTVCRPRWPRILRPSYR